MAQEEKDKSDLLIEIMQRVEKKVHDQVHKDDATYQALQEMKQVQRDHDYRITDNAEDIQSLHEVIVRIEKRIDDIFDRMSWQETLSRFGSLMERWASAVWNSKALRVITALGLILATAWTSVLEEILK